MATDSGKQTQHRPWNPPRYETADERARREEREGQSRFLIDAVKLAWERRKNNLVFCFHSARTCARKILRLRIAKTGSRFLQGNSKRVIYDPF